MSYIVSIKQVQARPIAAVRARLHPRDIAGHFRAALDKVWTFLGYYPHLKGGSRNVFLYGHDVDETGAMSIDFGVEVAQAFATGGEVFCTNTPAGEAAFTVHRGPYAGLSAGHDAVRAWIVANGRQDAGRSWEVYGDWNDDPKKLETQIFYLLR
jgi:effector-binding domain-containing protein